MHKLHLTSSHLHPSSVPSLVIRLPRAPPPLKPPLETTKPSVDLHYQGAGLLTSPFIHSFIHPWFPSRPHDLFTLQTQQTRDSLQLLPQKNCTDDTLFGFILQPVIIYRNVRFRAQSNPSVTVSISGAVILLQVTSRPKPRPPAPRRHMRSLRTSPSSAATSTSRFRYT